MASPIISSFNAGEISPALFGRVDLAKYYNGCEILENMIARPHGPAFKRPGTYFVKESMGRDEIVNGDFASDTTWDKGTGWTIAAGVAHHSTGTSSYLKQTTTAMNLNATFEVIFTLSNRTAGSVTPRLGLDFGTARTANGTYTERLINAGTTYFWMQASADFVGDIDNVSVREVAPITRIESFQFSTVQAYVLAFTDRNLRIFKDNGIILDGADPYEVTTPYDEDDLFDLQITQSADVMTIVHEDYEPRELTRTGHTSWTLTEIEFEDGPWEEQKDTGDLESMTITGATQADPCVITVDVADASDDDYIEITGVAGMTELNGNFYQLANKTGLTYSLKDMDGNAVDSTAFTAYTSGGLAKCTLKPSAVTGSITLLSWEDMFLVTDVDRLIRVKSQKIDEWATGTAYVTGDYALNGENYKCILDNTGKEPPNAMYWEESGKDGWYWAKITAYTNAKQVTALISGDDLPNAYPIVDYRMGIWCEANGYPSCVDYFEERLMFAGSTEYPQTVWGSASGDYDVMAPGTNDDDAFTYTINARGVNPIRWIVPQNVLLIGTMGSEWKMGSFNPEQSLNATNIDTKRQSTKGSARVQAQLIGDVVLFVQRAGTKIRELTEDPSSITTKYIAPDLTLLAEHITKGGIVDMAYQQEPSALLWCIRDDGVLLGMTYERTQDVVGWHRQVTDGEFGSVAVIPDTEDQIWVAVKRTIGSEDRRYIEYFKPHDWGSDVMDCFFVDSGITSDKGDTLTITGVTQADPALITCANTFSSGEKIKILGIEGMTELNENIYIVDNDTATDFEILDLDGNNVDSTAFAAYVSGGTVQEVAKDYSGLDHLEGKTVSILADGCVQTPCVVSGGAIEISEYANLVHVGLPFSPKLKPMNLEAGQSEGTAQGKTKRIHKATVRLQDTMACKVGSCEDDLEEISFRSDSDAMDAPVPLFTGDKELNMFPGGYDTSGDILITNDVPLPLTVVAILPALRVYEG